MKLVFWNIRGLNFKGKLRYLKDRIKKEKPYIILLHETKIIMEKLKQITRRSYPIVKCMVLDAKHYAGGDGNPLGSQIYLLPKLDHLSRHPL